jgi:hypothetical protein
MSSMLLSALQSSESAWQLQASLHVTNVRVGSAGHVDTNLKVWLFAQPTKNDNSDDDNQNNNNKQRPPPPPPSPTSPPQQLEQHCPQSNVIGVQTVLALAVNLTNKKQKMKHGGAKLY